MASEGTPNCGTRVWVPVATPDNAARQPFHFRLGSENVSFLLNFMEMCDVYYLSVINPWWHLVPLLSSYPQLWPEFGDLWVCDINFRRVHLDSCMQLLLHCSCHLEPSLITCLCLWGCLITLSYSLIYPFLLGIPIFYFYKFLQKIWFVFIDEIWLEIYLHQTHFALSMTSEGWPAGCQEFLTWLSLLYDGSWSVFLQLDGYFMIWNDDFVGLRDT